MGRVWLVVAVALGQLARPASAFNIEDYYRYDSQQFLLGKYLDYDNIRVIHYLIWVAMCVVLLALGASIVRYLNSVLEKKRSKFPDLGWMRETWKVVCPKLETYSHGAKLVADAQEHVLPPENPGQGDPRWSLTAEYNLLRVGKGLAELREPINFAEQIRSAHKILETLVTRRLPFIVTGRSVKDYLTEVCNRFSISAVRREQLIEAYELARFSSHSIAPGRKQGTADINAKYFEEYIKCLVEVMNAINGGAESKQKIDDDVRQFHSHAERAGSRLAAHSSDIGISARAARPIRRARQVSRGAASPLA